MTSAEGLLVVRPVKVDRVERDEDLLVVRSGERVWCTRTPVSAIGTRTRPGGGASAVQFLGELAP